MVTPSWTPGFTYLFYILFKACSKGHFGNNCNETCDGCISELCNSSDGVCDIEDICKAGWYGLKCDKGKCIKLYKYSWKLSEMYELIQKRKNVKKSPLGNQKIDTSNTHIYYYSLIW